MYFSIAIRCILEITYTQALLTLFVYIGRIRELHDFDTKRKCIGIMQETPSGLPSYSFYTPGWWSNQLQIFLAHRNLWWHRKTILLAKMYSINSQSFVLKLMFNLSAVCLLIGQNVQKNAKILNFANLKKWTNKGKKISKNNFWK